MLVVVPVKKIIPVELLDISRLVTEMGVLEKTIEMELQTMNILADFACKAHLRSNDTFAEMAKLVPVINLALKPVRVAIMSDSCTSSNIPDELLKDEKVFYRLDLRRGEM